MAHVLLYITSRMKLYKYTEEQLREAIKTSTSKRQVLLKLGVKAAGGNYQVLGRAIEFFNLDTSHFTGQGWNKGKSLGFKRPLEDYLSNKFSIHSDRLRRRLIREKVFDEKCTNCNRRNWLGETIPLELDHIDGNNQNNLLSNLRLLCPNCHALTPTYRGKNKSR